MNMHYKLENSGLNYLISSREYDVNKKLLSTILCFNDQSVMPKSELEALNLEGSQDLENHLKQMIEKGWISTCVAEQCSTSQMLPFNLIQMLSLLSDSSPVALIDANGLVIASRGFQESDIAALAATASSMMRVGEQARSRNPTLNTEKPFSIKIQWGELSVRIQMITIGRKKLSLLISGAPKVGKTEYFKLIAALTARYNYE